MHDAKLPGLKVELPVRTQTWWQLLTIQASAVLCIPNLLAGHIINSNLGWKSGLFSVIAANLILLFLAMGFSRLSAKQSLSTAQHAAPYFGNSGSAFLALLMIAFMLSWFGIQLNVMSIGLQQLISMAHLSISTTICNLLIGMILTFIMCSGIKTIKNISVITAPLLFLTLIYMSITRTSPLSDSGSFSFSWLGGISPIIGVNIGCVMDMPTYFRHAKSERDAKICIWLLYLLLTPRSRSSASI